MHGLARPRQQLAMHPGDRRIGCEAAGVGPNTYFYGTSLHKQIVWQPVGKVMYGRPKANTTSGAGGQFAHLQNKPVSPDFKPQNRAKRSGCPRSANEKTRHLEGLVHGCPLKPSSARRFMGGQSLARKETGRLAVSPTRELVTPIRAPNSASLR